MTSTARSTPFCDAGTNECVAFDFGICLTDGDCPVGSYCDPADQGCYIPPIAECSVDRDCNNGFECDSVTPVDPNGSARAWPTKTATQATSA